MPIRSILFVFILLYFSKAEAHSHGTSAAMLVHQGDNWMLQVIAEKTAFEDEVHFHFGEDAYQTPEEFQDLVFQHVKGNLSIIFDKTIQVELQEVKVQLGHETIATFLVKNVSDKFEYIQFRNSSFKDIHHHQSTLLIYEKGVDKEQIELNDQNNHTLELKLVGSKLVVLSNDFTVNNPSIKDRIDKLTSNLIPFILAVVGLLAVVSIFLLKKRSRNDIAA